MILKKPDNSIELKKADRSLEEERIRKTEAVYDQAWKQGDIEGILAALLGMQ